VSASGEQRERQRRTKQSREHHSNRLGERKTTS
jgi:hypothetical protein